MICRRRRLAELSSELTNIALLGVKNACRSAILDRAVTMTSHQESIRRRLLPPLLIVYTYITPSWRIKVVVVPSAFVHKKVSKMKTNGIRMSVVLRRSASLLFLRRRDSYLYSLSSLVSVGIVEDLGQFKTLLDPGFHCLFWPITNIVGRLVSTCSIRRVACCLPVQRILGVTNHKVDPVIMLLLVICMLFSLLLS